MVLLGWKDAGTSSCEQVQCASAQHGLCCGLQSGQGHLSAKGKGGTDAGALVSDGSVAMIKDRIQEDDCRNGALLDGFPRTLAQATALDAMLSENGENVSSVLAIEVPHEILEERICGRWMHKASGRSYHVTFAPPKSLPKGATPSAKNMLDDVTGDPLYQRSDDTASALKTRLASYSSKTVPILQHYEAKSGTRVYKVNGNQSSDAVWAEIDSFNM